MRHRSNRPLWCITTSSHCGMTLRLQPRNSGTSVCTASSWPGTIRFAKAMAGSTTGRSGKIARAASTNAWWCRNGSIPEMRAWRP